MLCLRVCPCSYALLNDRSDTEIKATFGVAQTEGVVVEVATRDPRAYKAAFQTIPQDFF
jgi:hypothetical protein